MARESLKEPTHSVFPAAVRAASKSYVPLSETLRENRAQFQCQTGLGQGRGLQGEK